MLKYVDMVELTSNHEDGQRWLNGETPLCSAFLGGHRNQGRLQRKKPPTLDRPKIPPKNRGISADCMENPHLYMGLYGIIWVI